MATLILPRHQGSLTEKNIVACENMIQRPELPEESPLVQAVALKYDKN